LMIQWVMVGVFIEAGRSVWSRISYGWCLHWVSGQLWLMSSLRLVEVWSRISYGWCLRWVSRSVMVGVFIEAGRSEWSRISYDWCLHWGW
jgi:hypothetical protein